MFKKKCKNCNSSISKNFDFCPSCGSSIKNQQDKEENWGMLGKNDFLESPNKEESFFGGGILNKMLNNAMHMLEKEMQKEVKNPEINQSKKNLQIYINGKRINLGQLTNKGNNIQNKTKPKILKKQTLIKLPQNNLKDFSKLPRKEPETNIRRLSDKIIYEIKMPGINSINNISITQLENSIEIKATTKNKAYYKIIKIGLPIINYNLSKEKLILELAAR